MKYCIKCGNELMEGSLSSIAKMPLEDILYDLVDTLDGASDSLTSEYGSFFKFFLCHNCAY